MFIKKRIATVLAFLMLLSCFSFTAANVFAANEIALQASDITGVLASFGIKAAAKTELLQGDKAIDGITVVKINPDPCEDRDPKYNTECRVLLESYPTAKGITPATYKYARMTYMYVPASDDTNSYTPSIEFMTTAGKWTTVPGTPFEANEWAYIGFDLSAGTYGAEDVISQFRIAAFGEAVGTYDYEGGSYNPNEKVLANPDSSLYIANIAFFTEAPGVPTITGISFASESVSITRGKNVVVPAVTVEGTGSPITSYDLMLSGHTSQGTKLSADGTMIYVGEDETADTITLTATSVIDDSLFATLTINVTDPRPRSTFDDENVVMSFGVVSDVHLSGSWNQPRSKAKWSHVIDVFQKLGADAILANGDLTDAIASSGNVNGNGYHNDKSSYGTKAEQNYREVGYFAQAMWGAADGGYGNGNNDTTKIFYVLGNHDENGKGYTPSYNKGNGSFTPVYSADYFAAVICGWQYNPNSEAALAVPDGMEPSYRMYIADLLDYNNNPETTGVTAESFYAEHGVTLASADAKFDKFFGFDEADSLDDTHGLRFGNRHMTIDPDGTKDNDFTDDIHFVGIELSQSDESIIWAEKIIKKSIEENPEKPIFFITHYKTAGTSVIGSGNTDRLANLLCKYPQTFVWGGHNHSFLASDRAIDTTQGYVATDSAVTAYASMYNLTNSNAFGFNSGTEKYAQNAATKENHAFGNGAYVEIDKDFNVRINRIDLYRSFSADYAKNTSLFSSGEFTDFANKASFTPVDEAVFIREPWDLTDIGPEGLHLEDYTTARFEKSGVPTFASSGSLKVESNKIGSIPVTFTMNATDDGMVYMYLLELCNSQTDEVLKRFYYTNKFYDYPDGNIPEITIDHSFTGLSPNTTYKVKLTAVDDLMNRGVALVAEATTFDGDAKMELDDGRIAVFVDASENPIAEYEWTDGNKYFVCTSFEEAAALNPDIVYFIKGEGKLYVDSVQELMHLKSGAKVIGLDRDNCLISYNSSFTLGKDLWFENVSLNKMKGGDSGLTLQGHTLTLIDVKASSNPINIFNSGWGGNDPSGKLVIKGDTGKINCIYPGPNYGNNTGSKGDVTIILEGGTYDTVGGAKAMTGNKINGNVYITVTGGTYKTITASSTSANHQITKNALLKVLGGELSETTVSVSGTTNVLGKDVVVIASGLVDKIGTLNKADNQIQIIVPDDVTDAVAEPSFDGNGYITSFAIKQVEGKSSFVNGAKATTLAVENGKTYEITYKTANAIEFDLNGGNGTVPATITGSAGEDVTANMPTGDGLTRENYSFLGWSLDKNAASPDASFTITADGNIAYAVWKAKEKITITLDANGGACDTATVQEFEGATTVLPSAAKTNAVFLGWAEDKDAELGALEFTAKVTTLYAIFKDVGTKVVYADTKYDGEVSDGGYFTPYTSFADAATAAGSEAATIVIKNADYFASLPAATGTLTITSLDPATGENYTETNNAYFHIDGNNIKRPVTLEDIKLYNKSGNGYGFINANGNKLVIGEGVTVVPKGESPATGVEAANQIVRIRAGSYNGSFDSSNVVVMSPDVVANIHGATGKDGKITNSATVVLYENVGEVNLGNDGASGTVGANVNLIVYKTFDTELKASLYNLTTIGGAVNYIFNNGSLAGTTFTHSISDSTTVTKGVYTIDSEEGGIVLPTETAGTFEIITEENNIFVNGSRVEKSADNLYALGQAGEYRIEYSTPGHIVSYNPNGAEGDIVEVTVKEGNSVDLESYDLEREGYTFLGWAEDSDATEALTELTMGTSDIKLYAVWEINKYTVTFDANGGSYVGELADLEKLHDTALVLPTDYILYGTGLEFVGWSANPDATADDVVTEYTGNEAITFFAIYNVVGTANVTPDSSDEQLPDGTYFVITDSDAVVEEPEFDIPGTASEIAKVEITLIDATTGNEAELVEPATFTVDCGEDLTGKAVFVYHADIEEFEECTVSENEVTFTTDSLSTFVIYTVEVEAAYILKGQYNIASETYTVSLYYKGAKANSGSFGFNYDEGYTFTGFTLADNLDSIIEAEHDEEHGMISGTWYPVNGGYIGGDDEEILIGTFTFVCDSEYYDRELSAERFTVSTPDDDINEIYADGYYLYAKHAENSLNVEFAPIVIFDVEDAEPITVTYLVSASYETVRADGDTPVSFAKAIVMTENGVKLTEFDIEDENTDTATVSFEFESAPGTYKLAVVKNGYIETETIFTVTDSDVELDTIVPVAGDVRGNENDAQGDGEINLADFVRVLRGFEYSSLASHVDIDENGIVNVTDLAYVKAHFGTTK